MLNAYPERFLFGSDSVAPANPDAYLKTYRDYIGCDLVRNAG